MFIKVVSKCFIAVKTKEEKMGQTLQRAAQWTSAQDGTSGKLEFTSLNEELLNTILGFLEDGKLNEELNLIFKKPLEWKTTLTIEDFEIPGYKRK